MRLKGYGAKLAAASLTIVTAAALSACGSSSSDSGGSPSASSSTGSSSSGAATTSDTSSGAPSWCGSREITLALADGFGDNNWRQITTAEARDEAAKCPAVTKFVYTDGQGNTQKSISDIQGLTAQGVNAMVVFPDQGKAVLPALRSAYRAGVVTVPYRVNPGGEAGQDYDAFISTDFSQAGELWGRWLVTALRGRGNVANLGGPPANSQSQDEYDGMQRVLAGYPDIRFVGQTPYNVTNWDAAKTQQVVTALLAKYPQIDAITTDFGSALASSTGAFRAANRSIPAVATEDANELSCTFKEEKASNPDFQLFTVDSQTWMVRAAIDYAVAKATGAPLPPTTVPQRPFEDSISGKPHPVMCDRSLSGDAILSSQLPKDQIAAALK
ncbi:MAG TPA: substrate-binding domain-containing protein [Conexibacter sp.]|jgi:ribose transport system substrate-binding protein